MKAKAKLEKIRCKNCGKLFLPKRAWQKFHNDNCRVQYHRMPVNSLKKSIELLDKAIKKSPV